MVEVIGRSAPIPYVEARVGISFKICCFFGTGVKRVYAGFFWDRLSSWLQATTIKISTRPPESALERVCGNNHSERTTEKGVSDATHACHIMTDEASTLMIESFA
jgi:hypothetical protein